MSPRAAVRTLTTLTALLAVLVLGGCSSEFGGPANQSGAEATGSGPARSKLLLQIQDPCYSGDARAEWSRCARWEEEVAGTARTAGQAAPADRAVTDAVATVAAGHDAFGRAGCTVAQPTLPTDPGPCIAAVLRTREGIRALAPRLGVPAA
jgi:hypothetical protein